MDKTIKKYISKTQRSVQKHSEESALEIMLKRIRRTHEFPSISKYLIEINSKLSDDQDKSNASELANIIIKDYALTNKLLKLVNSAFYGLVAGKVTTVTRAVVVLGIENIRLTTLSLILFEHFKSKSNLADIKEVIISSFWAGVLARDIAKMDDGINPEEAFVCAMMNQLGKLLMIYYEPDKYRKICDRMLTHKENETNAAKRAYGVTYDDLGMAVAKQWNFPPQIYSSMPILTDAELKDKDNPPDKLWVLSSFVKELGSAIRWEDSKAPNQTIKDLIHRYQKRIKILKGQLKIHLIDSLEKTQKHAVAMDFNVDRCIFLNCLANFSQQSLGQPEPVPPEEPSEKIPHSSFLLINQEEIKFITDAVAIKTPKDIIVEGIQDISEVMMSDFDVNDVALMSLEILYRSLNFHRALMFIREGDGKMMTVRYGYGQSVSRLIRKIRFRIVPGKDLFSISIEDGKDLIVADAYDANLNELIPTWYRKYIDAPAFIFLPVILKNICIGAFYADRDKDGSPVSKIEHRHLSMLRNQLFLALKYSQADGQ